jgi:hypothetical protein
MNNEIGTCKSFNKVGDSCRPFSPSDLTNPNIPDKLKCAVIMPDNDTPSQQAVNAQGVCVGFTCRTCNPDGGGSSSFETCSGTDGKADARSCTHPGTLIDSYKSAWHQSNYAEDPVSVWLAIIYTFILLMFFIQIAQLVLQLLAFLRK